MCAIHGTLTSFVFVILSVDLCVGNCVLPEHPEHGKHEPHELDCPKDRTRPKACEGVPGTVTSEDWLLTVQCDPGYVPEDSSSYEIPSVCAGGEWYPPLPSCVANLLKNDFGKCTLPKYPKNGQYEPLAVECGLKPGMVPQPGTPVPSDCVLMYFCNPNYQLTRPGEHAITVCHNKIWNPSTDNVECERSKEPPSVSAATTSSPIETSTTLIRQSIGRPSSSECVLPGEPDNRVYCLFTSECEDCGVYSYNRQCSLSSGSTVKDRVPVKVQCDQGYGMIHGQQHSVSVCINQNWIPPMPQCLKQCPALLSESLLLECWLGPTRVDCDKPSLPDTTATYQCRPSYSEYPDLAQAGLYSSTLTCRSTGQWSHALPFCKPDCGVSKGIGKIVPTIVDGKDTELGAFPWHAGLYQREDSNKPVGWKNICGGSLISNRIVLTAAHCVAHLKPSDLRIALGKYYRTWEHDEPLAVKSNVSAITIPAEYNPLTYAWDIALVLLNKKIRFGNYIMPVCRSFQGEFNYVNNNTVYVVGWGKTSDGGAESETLLNSDVTVTPASICQRKLPSAIPSYEKFCGIKESGSVVQKGDSGGGVTAVYNGLHYILGIVSIKYNEVSLFTNVTWPTHVRWAESEIRNFDKIISL